MGCLRDADARRFFPCSIAAVGIAGERMLLINVVSYPVSSRGRQSVSYGVVRVRTSLTGEDWQMDVLDEKALRAKVQSVVAAQSQLHEEVA